MASVAVTAPVKFALHGNLKSIGVHYGTVQTQSPISVH